MYAKRILVFTAFTIRASTLSTAKSVRSPYHCRSQSAACNITNVIHSGMVTSLYRIVQFVVADEINRHLDTFVEELGIKKMIEDEQEIDELFPPSLADRCRNTITVEEWRSQSLIVRDYRTSPLHVLPTYFLHFLHFFPFLSLLSLSSSSSPR